MTLNYDCDLSTFVYLESKESFLCVSDFKKKFNFDRQKDK